MITRREGARAWKPKRCLLACDSALAVMQHIIGDAGRVGDDVHGTFLQPQAHAGISLEQPTHKRPAPTNEAPRRQAFVVAASLARSGAGIYPRASSFTPTATATSTAAGHTCTRHVVARDMMLAFFVLCALGKPDENGKSWRALDRENALHFAVRRGFFSRRRVPCFTLPRLSLSPFFLLRVTASCLSAFLFFLRKLRSTAFFVLPAQVALAVLALLLQILAQVSCWLHATCEHIGVLGECMALQNRCDFALEVMQHIIRDTGRAGNDA
eukprot:CAMPEP_0173118094 /NCGR_PEP_ID=MMETSP1102-20130122/50757_1 /TAXON_ID=49646 /ORGANISM="Geminigera sp., Strain Caron Lab Isolate" /LENGTH=268 /DNA_ID=CAMNT_0014022987 /DNA_START=54 /DNA_END=858 /DNA_ORIENTATION=+